MAPFLNLFTSVVYTLQPLQFFVGPALAPYCCANGVWMFAYMGSKFVFFLQRIAMFYPHQPKHQMALRICTAVHSWSMVLANFTQVVFNSHVIIEIDGHHRFSMLISFLANMLTMPLGFLLSIGCVLFGWLTVYRHMHETMCAAPTSSNRHRYFILLLMCVSASTTIVSATLTSIKTLFAPDLLRVCTYFVTFDSLLSVVLAAIVFYWILDRRRRLERSRTAAVSAASCHMRATSTSSLSAATHNNECCVSIDARKKTTSATTTTTAATPA